MMIRLSRSPSLNDNDINNKFTGEATKEMEEHHIRAQHGNGQFYLGQHKLLQITINVDPALQSADMGSFVQWLKKQKLKHN